MGATTGMKGVNYTINAAPLPGSLKSPLWGGQVIAKVDSIVFAATGWDSGSTFYMGRVPKGCYVLGFDVISALMTNAVTMTIGDGTTADLFGAITTLAAASKQHIPSSVPTTKLTADTDILLTTGGANCAAAGTFMLVIYILLPLPLK